MNKKIIVCAAIRCEGHIVCGARHYDDIMRKCLRWLGITYGEHEQGFIDQYGNFYNRKEAMEVVKESGQSFDKERNVKEDELFSEGLY